MEFELVRTLTHDVLRDMLLRVQKDPSSFGQFSSDMQVASIIARVGRLAKQRDIKPNDGLTNQEQHFVIRALWELIIQGFLVPNNASSGTQGWPFVSFTDYGEKMILADRPTPYDPTMYLAQFVEGLTDPIVNFYVEEALGCFRTNCQTACALMLGVASERLFDLLLDSFLGALASQRERDDLQKKTDSKSITSRYRELRKRLDPKKGQLPQPLCENLDTCLVSILNIIRQQRNDAGHPTGRVVTRDEAYALLHVFPHYHNQMSELTLHLKEHTKSLT